MDWDLIEKTVNGVWSNSTDAELQAATPEKFYKDSDGCDLTDEEHEEAMVEFFERRQRVFGLGL